MKLFINIATKEITDLTNKNVDDLFNQFFLQWIFKQLPNKFDNNVSIIATDSANSKNKVELNPIIIDSELVFLADIILDNPQKTLDPIVHILDILCTSDTCKKLDVMNIPYIKTKDGEIIDISINKDENIEHLNHVLSKIPTINELRFKDMYFLVDNPSFPYGHFQLSMENGHTKDPYIKFLEEFKEISCLKILFGTKLAKKEKFDNKSKAKANDMFNRLIKNIVLLCSEKDALEKYGDKINLFESVELAKDNETEIKKEGV